MQVRPTRVSARAAVSPAKPAPTIATSQRSVIATSPSHYGTVGHVRHAGRDRSRTDLVRQELRSRSQRGPAPRLAAGARPRRGRDGALHPRRDRPGAAHPRGAAEPAVLDVGRGDRRQPARRGDRQRGGVHAPALRGGRADRDGSGAARARARGDGGRGGRDDRRAPRRARPGRRLRPRRSQLHVSQQLPDRGSPRRVRRRDRGAQVAGRGGDAGVLDLESPDVAVDDRRERSGEDLRRRRRGAASAN